MPAVAGHVKGGTAYGGVPPRGFTPATLTLEEYVHKRCFCHFIYTMISAVCTKFMPHAFTSCPPTSMGE
jgi:hypothetical protein